MPRFDYVRAQSVEHALALLADPAHTSRPLAGGTDLLVLIRHQKPAFDRVVDLTRVPEMKAIERRGDEVYIGAAATFTDVAESPVLQEFAPCLVEAALTVGGPAIRNTGTLGGNTINAAACADGVPSLVCLDAVAHLASTRRKARAPGQRPGDRGEPHRAPARRAADPFHVSAAAGRVARQAFTKLGRRNAQAISRLSMAAPGRLDEHGCVDYVRLVPGAAMPTPRRFAEVEKMLLGQAPTDDLLAAAGRQDRRVDARSHRPPLVDRIQRSRNPGVGRAHAAPGAGRVKGGGNAC